MVCMSIVFLPDTESNTLPFISISVSVSMLLASIPTTRTSLPAGLGTKYGSDCPNVRHPTEILPTGLCSVHNLIQKSLTFTQTTARHSLSSSHIKTWMQTTESPDSCICWSLP